MLAKNQIRPGALKDMRPALDAQNNLAVALWNQMGGIDWAALPILIVLYDIADLEGLLNRLVVIRDFVGK
jgi:hypothetical protein